jgi:hypothetical protein
MNIAQVIGDQNLLGRYFEGPSWDRWRAVLKAAYALPLTERERVLFHEVAGERAPPRRPVRELVAVVGRGGGKNSAATGLATYIAITGNFSKLRPGERGIVLLLATDKEQAAISLDYLRGYFAEVPMLAAMVERDQIRDNRIDLKNRASIVVTTNNYRAPRGRTICAAIFDECAFWRSAESVAPDVETDAAVAPGLARFPGSVKIMISSAYRRAGLFYERYKVGFGAASDDCLVVLGTSLQFNPTLDQQIIDAELAKDWERNAAEYLSMWRDDLSSYISRAIVEGLIDHGVTIRPYDPRIRNYVAFTDESGGSGKDASTLSICHRDKDSRVIQDALWIWRPPFDPERVIRLKSELLKSYKLRKVVGDHWAGGLPGAIYRTHGITFEKSEIQKTDIYRDFEILLNSARVRFIENDQQINELLSLERRVHWGGRESIDHPAGDHWHDDAINATAGAAVLAAGRTGPAVVVTQEMLRLSAMPEGMARAYLASQGPAPAAEISEEARELLRSGSRGTPFGLFGESSYRSWSVSDRAGPSPATAPSDGGRAELEQRMNSASAGPNFGGAFSVSELLDRGEK